MTESPFDLTGRHVIVIGAGSGIGESVAEGCANAGAEVTCADLDGGAAASVAERIVTGGGTAHAATLDVRHAEQVASCLEHACERAGGLHGVVCTPGTNVRKPTLDYTPAEFDRVVELNLKGSFNVLQAAGRLLVREGGGSIVLFSSIRSVTVEPGQSVYAATKAGIVQLARTLAAELGPKGVRVNTVAPGVVDTPLTEPIRTRPDWYRAYADKSALGRWARADEMVGPTVFLLADASSYVTGSVLFVDGGWTAIDGRFDPPGMV